MPELAGDLFYREVGRARPRLLKRFIFLTANADNPLYETFLKSLNVPVIAKPASVDERIGEACRGAGRPIPGVSSSARIPIRTGFA